VTYAALALGEAHLLSGKPDRALVMLESAAGGEKMPRVADSWRAYFLELLTRCRLALEDRDGAERAAELAVASAGEIELPLPQAWADRAVAAVAYETGDSQTAVKLATRSAESA